MQLRKQIHEPPVPCSNLSHPVNLLEFIPEGCPNICVLQVGITYILADPLVLIPADNRISYFGLLHRREKTKGIGLLDVVVKPHQIDSVNILFPDTDPMITVSKGLAVHFFYGARKE